MDQAVAGLVLNVVVEAAHADPAAKDAAFSTTNIETKTAIVSKLHERRRVLSGLAVKSMLPWRLGSQELPKTQCAKTRKPFNRSWVPCSRWA